MAGCAGIIVCVSGRITIIILSLQLADCKKIEVAQHFGQRVYRLK